MSNKMSKQVPSIEMFEALVATVNNLSEQLAYTKKSMSALQESVDSLSINSDIKRNLLRTDISDNSRISNAKIPGLEPWRNYHGQ